MNVFKKLNDPDAVRFIDDGSPAHIAVVSGYLGGSVGLTTKDKAGDVVRSTLPLDVILGLLGFRPRFCLA